VLALRSKTYGLAGIGLGAIALLLGGGEAPPVTSASRPLTVGLDYFVLELLVLGLVFIPMERAWALREQDIFRPGWQTDLTHFFVSHAGVQLFSFLTLIPVQVALGWTQGGPLRAAVAAQPAWLQFLEILLVVDLVAYWVHRAFHHPRLWRFHAVHHSSPRLDWLAGSRIHLVDALTTRTAGFVPVFVLGFSAPALYAYLLFVSFHAVYIHANVAHRFPVLRWIVATPEFHHWHHTSDAEGLDRNFGVLVPLWDVVFGTAHQPREWPSRYGTVGEPLPDGYLAQLAYPFRRAPRAAPRRPQ
jgi:sterol desaturase/sphingolipid hydroxylase (fatty acid hydroxylase superfamily)